MVEVKASDFGSCRFAGTGTAVARKPEGTHCSCTYEAVARNNSSSGPACRAVAPVSQAACKSIFSGNEALQKVPDPAFLPMSGGVFLIMGRRIRPSRNQRALGRGNHDDVQVAWPVQ
jgi:hypothetical protein